MWLKSKKKSKIKKKNRKKKTENICEWECCVYLFYTLNIWTAKMLDGCHHDLNATQAICSLRRYLTCVLLFVTKQIHWSRGWTVLYANVHFFKKKRRKNIAMNAFFILALVACSFVGFGSPISNTQNYAIMWLWHGSGGVRLCGRSAAHHCLSRAINFQLVLGSPSASTSEPKCSMKLYTHTHKWYLLVGIYIYFALHSLESGSMIEDNAPRETEWHDNWCRRDIKQYCCISNDSQIRSPIIVWNK